MLSSVSVQFAVMVVRGMKEWEPAICFDRTEGRTYFSLLGGTGVFLVIA